MKSPWRIQRDAVGPNYSILFGFVVVGILHCTSGLRPVLATFACKSLVEGDARAADIDEEKLFKFRMLLSTQEFWCAAK